MKKFIFTVLFWFAAIILNDYVFSISSPHFLMCYGGFVALVVANFRGELK